MHSALGLDKPCLAQPSQFTEVRAMPLYPRRQAKNVEHRVIDTDARRRDPPPSPPRRGRRARKRRTPGRNPRNTIRTAGDDVPGGTWPEPCFT
jgi:hypothetical protein